MEEGARGEEKGRGEEGGRKGDNYNMGASHKHKIIIGRP